jgi:diguanylate cyclase (GGDEF)-like protein
LGDSRSIVSIGLSPALAADLAARLAHLGVSVHPGDNLMEGWGLFESLQPDAVVVQLPHGELESMISRAHAARGRSHLPVLAFAPTAEARVRALSAGADDALSLEVGGEELALKVVGHLAVRLKLAGLLSENARLEVLSATDALTGLFNRRHFDDRLRDEFRRAQRYDDPLTLIVLDIDHFKRVNDAHGHAAGDAVLRAVAEALKVSVRETDLIARTGGEEFAVILPRTQLNGAITVAERVWKDVGDLKVAGIADRVTASFGVSAFPNRTVTSPESLVRSADEALYRAKREGRNKIALYRPPPTAERQA